MVLKSWIMELCQFALEILGTDHLLKIVSTGYSGDIHLQRWCYSASSLITDVWRVSLSYVFLSIWELCVYLFIGMQMKNMLALDIITQIMQNAFWLNVHFVPPDLHVFEIRVREGYGARWTADGSKVFFLLFFRILFE